MRERYTVLGWWQDSGERYGQGFDADSVRAAEEMMLEQARAEDGVFRIAGTMLGDHKTADTYTAFVDPEDPRNAERRCESVIEELEVTQYTVIGLVTSTRHHDRAWNQHTGGQRHLTREMALSPRIAEDLARCAVRERGEFELTVCAVFEGAKNRCETFPFANHDEQAGR